MTSNNYYLLPSSPLNKCIDRFSIVEGIEEDEDGQVPLWAILSELLPRDIASPGALVGLLETIAATINGSPGLAGDYGTLRRFLETRPRFFPTQWRKLANIALRMPELFSSHNLPILGQAHAASGVELSRRQVGCLVVHQFLATFHAPFWKDDELHTFAAWYGTEQRHDKAVLAYLEALFMYFEKLLGVPDNLETPEDGRTVRYALHDSSSMRPDPFSSSFHDAVPLSQLEVNVVENYSTDPSALGLPNGACVVSANRFVGFGQSATQEEIHVGCSPEACPVVLITPPLQHDQVLVVKGAEAMLNIKGQRRDIEVKRQQWPSSSTVSWNDRTMLFMDALELDMVSSELGLPDLQQGNIEREIKKATIAFSSGAYDEVLVGLWGCGAFCGDPGVKMTALWCAASLAGIKLGLVFDISQRSFAEEYETFAARVRQSYKTVNEVKQMLDSAPLTLERHHTLEWFTQVLTHQNQ